MFEVFSGTNDMHNIIVANSCKKSLKLNNGKYLVFDLIISPQVHVYDELQFCYAELIPN